jgi:hypothetical protein
MKAEEFKYSPNYLFEEGKKAGIKEVVDWIIENNRNHPQPYRGVNISREKWQSKFKEWGIK